MRSLSQPQLLKDWGIHYFTLCSYITYMDKHYLPYHPILCWVFKREPSCPIRVSFISVSNNILVPISTLTKLLTAVAHVTKLLTHPHISHLCFVSNCLSLSLLLLHSYVMIPSWVIYYNILPSREKSRMTHLKVQCRKLFVCVSDTQPWALLYKSQNLLSV